MRSRSVLRARSAVLLLAALTLLHSNAARVIAADASAVRLVRTPDGGIQPQAAVDAQGTVHLIYFKGEAGGGDIFYVRSAAGTNGYSAPIRVNHRAGSAIAAGSIRGAQLALGRNGRVHVAWMGSSKAESVRIAGKERTPMLYTRLNHAGAGFEPERNVLTWAPGLDGGGSVAADTTGNVYVAWHGSPPDSESAEIERAVYVARSRDDGNTFERERPANPLRTGACACCGLRAWADRRGDLYLLYRTAWTSSQRDMALLVSRDRAQSFQLSRLTPWKVEACPMSSSSLADGAAGVLAAWETQQQIEFASFTSADRQPPPSVSPRGTGKRKHPSIAQNAAGEILLAWTENTGWKKGGSLAWQRFDPAGRPLGEPGRAEGVPVWGLPAVVAKADGTFLIFY